jgi:hypothetical protein
MAMSTRPIQRSASVRSISISFLAGAVLAGLIVGLVGHGIWTRSLSTPSPTNPGVARSVAPAGPGTMVGQPAQAPNPFRIDQRHFGEDIAARQPAPAGTAPATTGPATRGTSGPEGRPPSACRQVITTRAC